MARKIGRLCCANGSYIKDGEERTRWLTCGVLLETDKGFRVKIEALPVTPQGEDGLWLACFEDEPRQQAPAASQAATGTPKPQEDVPF